MPPSRTWLGCSVFMVETIEDRLEVDSGQREERRYRIIMLRFEGNARCCYSNSNVTQILWGMASCQAKDVNDVGIYKRREQFQGKWHGARVFLQNGL